MKDVIHSVYGFGCHCRNCEFAEKLHNGGFGGWRCRLGILRNIVFNSFCSEGQPREEEEKSITSYSEAASYSAVKNT